MMVIHRFLSGFNLRNLRTINLKYETTNDTNYTNDQLVKFV